MKTRSRFMWKDRRIGAQIAANNRPDTRRELEQRLTLNAVLEQVRREAEARGPITPDNAREYLDWQANRIAELRRERGI